MRSPSSSSRLDNPYVRSNLPREALRLSQHHSRIDPRRAPGRKPSGQGRHYSYDHKRADQCGWITRLDTEERDQDGSPVAKAKYGMHALRHFFASWAIERGFSAKRLQTLLGHSSIQMTFDVYGHLFPSLEDDHAKFAAGELALVAAGK